MTREEAINRLEDTFEAWDGLVPHNGSLANKLSEALGMAIAALREQEERSKGCEACVPNISDDFWPEQLLIGSPKAGPFCPMCGRKLEVEG